MGNIDRRVPTYGLIAGVILILFFLSDSAANNFIGEKIEWKRTFTAGEVEIILITENPDNRQNSLIKYTDVLRHNFTVVSHYDKKVQLIYSYENYLGMKNVFNSTKLSYDLIPETEQKFISHTSLDNIGNNHIRHSIIIKNFSNIDQTLAWGQSYDNLIVFSQEAFLSGFIQSVVLRYAWAIAIPFVVISAKHLSDIWYGK